VSKSKVKRGPTEQTAPTAPTVCSGGVVTEVRDWLSRFVVTLRTSDIDVLALWAAHTHLTAECYTTPRLLIDGTPGSGKSTVLDHFARLCANPVHMGQVASPATLVRLIDASGEQGTTLLVDEADRNLRQDRPGVPDLLSVLNSGYRKGATRPVSVPDANGGWTVAQMPTFAPVVLAGNNPQLPTDTMSRAIRVLMVPAIEDDGLEDSDWEALDADIAELAARLVNWADSVRDGLSTINAPSWLRNRDRERWLPLLRVGIAASDEWAERAAELAKEDLERARLDREDDVLTKAPAEQVLHDIHDLWPAGLPFVSTASLLAELSRRFPDRWGKFNDRGPLTAQRLGRMLATRHDIRSEKSYVQGGELRGYYRQAFASAWRRWGVEDPPTSSDNPSEPSMASESSGNDDLERAQAVTSKWLGAEKVG
jgi:Protein of unknown function (DUF3631)